MAHKKEVQIGEAEKLIKVGKIKFLKNEKTREFKSLQIS